ncbi:MAG: hypothetical protein Q9213_005380 [Squamulea squamosa]
MEVMETSNSILKIIFEYALNKFNDTIEQHAAGRPKFLSVINHFVTEGTQVEMCLPAFPFKSANKVEKVFGVLPDKAEELALERLNNMCIRIRDVYPPGAKLTIISDGLVYNDLLGIPDRDTWAYGEALRTMAVQKGFNHIDFSRLQDLVDFPLPAKLEEITYIANATNFRRFLFNKFGKDDLDIDHEIATNPDTQMTYLGYRRFLESDLRYIFPLGEGRSNHRYKKDVRYLAKQMLIRGHAFAEAVKSAFPNHLRLSIHQSTGEHKVSMSLLHTKTGFTTPWHCSVALLADGEWVSATMAEFKKNPMLEIVYEGGRPSFFRDKACGMQEPNSSDNVPGKKAASTRLNEHSASTLSETEAATEKAVNRVEEKLQDEEFTPPSSCSEGSEEETITKLVRTLSYHGVKNENGEPINPFFGSEHPSLDPSSENFGELPDQDLRLGQEAYQKVEANQDPDLEGFRWLGQEWRNDSGTRKAGKVSDALMELNQADELSGCSTLLKTISGETDGFYVANESYLNYQGIPKDTMHNDFRGECIYQAEVDVHFPQLTVGQTLDFAARARAPHNRLPGVSRDIYAEHLRDVGDDFIRGVSGGERKRVSIAEAAIAGSPLQCWDNSTRGLDSATALEFVRTIRTSTELTGATAIVSLYQASQSIYEVFDKVAVLYEGRQIYFGDIHAAKTFFVDLGFACPPRQTTADFLTSLTSPAERVVRKGFEGRTPSTPDEFAAVWQNSTDRARLFQEIQAFDSQYPIGIIFNSVMALVIGSVFYNLPNNTGSLYSRGALLFFGILLAAFASALEVRFGFKANEHH